MNDWVSHKLGDLFSSHAPGEWGYEPQGDDGDYFVLRSTNFTKDGHLDYSNVVVRHIPEAKRSRCTLKAGDILLEKSGGGPDQAVGRVAIFEGDSNQRFGYANFIERLCVADNFDTKFVMFRLLQSYRDGLTVRYEQQTTGIRNLKLRDFLSEKVSTPPLPQQRKIARILTTVDNLIEKTEALIAKYQAIKQGMMHDLFTRGVDSRGHLRPPYEEAPELYKQSELGWIPKEWEVRRVQDVLDDITYGLTVRPQYVEEGIPLVSGKECRDGWIDYSECNRITKADFGLLRQRSMPKPGHVLITKTGTLGRVAQIHANDPVSAITQNVALLKPNALLIASDFLESILAGDKIQSDISRETTVLSIPDLQLGVLGRFLIPLPSLTEQDLLCKRCKQLQDVLSTELRQLQKLRIVKTGLMQDLLTGKVRVKADEDEEVAAHA
jgi:type I restriction enzyme S subunit